MEVLIATGIMAIGLVMVATIFPVGVKLTTLTTERTIGAVAADEAFAKVQLYGLRDFYLWPSAQLNAGDPNATYYACDDFQYTVYLQDFNGDGVIDNLDESVPKFTEDFQYPSSMTLDQQDRNYHWSALCRRVGPKDVQVTVFINRKIGPAAYRAWDPVNGVLSSDWPKPVPVNVTFDSVDPLKSKELVIIDGPAFNAVDSRYFFGNGYTIVDNYSGNIYRVLEVKDANPVDGLLDTIVLQQDWVVDPLKPATIQDAIWVVPPAVGSDRYPCVGVYQKVIRFDNIN
jgi:hypothetical protein